MFFNWFGFGRTETEKKRDKYKELAERLEDAIAEHDDKVSEAAASYRTYTHTVPNLSNSKIPSNDFDTKREELNGRLQADFQKDKEMRRDLMSAKSKAYEKYEYYRNLAIREEREEEARKERERKEREQKNS